SLAHFCFSVTLLAILARSASRSRPASRFRTPRRTLRSYSAHHPAARPSAGASRSPPSRRSRNRISSDNGAAAPALPTQRKGAWEPREVGFGGIDDYRRRAILPEACFRLLRGRSSAFRHRGRGFSAVVLRSRTPMATAAYRADPDCGSLRPRVGGALLRRRPEPWSIPSSGCCGGLCCGVWPLPCRRLL